MEYVPFRLPNGFPGLRGDLKDCIPDSVTHLSFGSLFDTKTPKEALENVDKETSSVKIMESYRILPRRLGTSSQNIDFILKR